MVQMRSNKTLINCFLLISFLLSPLILTSFSPLPDLSPVFLLSLLCVSSLSHLSLSLCHISPLSLFTFSFLFSFLATLSPLSSFSFSPLSHSSPFFTKRDSTSDALPAILNIFKLLTGNFCGGVSFPYSYR